MVNKKCLLKRNYKNLKSRLSDTASDTVFITGNKKKNSEKVIMKIFYMPNVNMSMLSILLKRKQS